MASCFKHSKLYRESDARRALYGCANSVYDLGVSTLVLKHLRFASEAEYLLQADFLLHDPRNKGDFVLSDKLKHSEMPHFILDCLYDAEIRVRRSGKFSRNDLALCPL